MAALLSECGDMVTDAPAEADVIVINSCTVTASGDSRLFAAIRRLRRINPGAILVLTGCYAQAFPEEAAALDGVDLILGTRHREKLPALLESYVQGTAPRLLVESYTGDAPFEALPCGEMGHNTRAFFKIQDGCNCFCRYCIIPYARGRLRSMPPEQVAEHARQYANKGFREIVLCGINLGFYGAQWHETLAQAAEICAKTPGIDRVRLSSLEPDRIDGELLRRLAALPEFCPQFHLSLQSGCDTTLQRMGRHYRAADYRSICQQIRAVFPDAAITTDFMVGFPGETEAEFYASYDFATAMGFAGMHVFRYSPRPGTPAAKMPMQVPEPEKIRRMQLAQTLAKSGKAAFLRRQIGQTVPVLFERERGDGYHIGHAPNGTLVRILQKNPKKGLRNRIFYVRIEESDADCCYGTCLAADANG